MTIEVNDFGKYSGKTVKLVHLFGSDGTRISFMNWAAAIQNWVTKDKNFKDTSVVLGFNEFDKYPNFSPYFGAIVGRVINRINKGRFSFNGKNYQLPINRPPNHLHGGETGLSKLIWDLDIDSSTNSLLFSIKSLDGHEGYPGNVNVSVKYKLKETKLSIEIKAEVDRPTPINMGQHNYFNLCPNSTNISNYNICDHELFIDSLYYTETDINLIPTGKLKSLINTKMDFKKNNKKIDRIELDDNFILNSKRNLDKPAAFLFNINSGLLLKLWTDQPGIQVYNAPKLNIKELGLNNRSYNNFAGICLEAQKYPDSLNHKNFPSIITTPDKPYYQKTEIDISLKQTHT